MPFKLLLHDAIFLTTCLVTLEKEIHCKLQKTLHVALERLRNENEDKAKTQMTQSFNQYSENETKIWRQNILNQFNRVFVLSSFLFRNLSIDDYAKDGGPGRSDLDVVFTMIPCATNFLFGKL